MRLSRARWAAAAVVISLSAGAVYAQGDRTVARIGSHEITAREVEKRLSQMPLFQLKSLGKTPEEVKLKFVEQLASLELMVQAAREAKMEERHDVRDRIVDLLAQALLNDLYREAMEAGEVSDAEVAAYYNANKARYAPEQRLKIWQIVVAERAGADKLLATIKTDPEYAKDPTASWEKLASENSLDKSTAMRGGNIGFVQPDGQTAHKDVRVPKEIYDAAAKVADGEVVPEPIAVGQYWVIVQRRGSHVTPERTLASEGPTIRGLLAREKVDKRRKELLAKLRAQYISDLNPAAIDQIEVGQDGELTPQGRPGALRRSHPAAGKGRPQGPSGDMR